MRDLSRQQTILSWVLQVGVAGILLQTLFFKFTGADESVYIFSTIGQWAGVPGLEPAGRLGTGLIELVAALLLLVPATAALGAALTAGVMAGAIASHLLILGIDVRGDGGLLFTLAVVSFVASAIVFVLRRTQIPVLGQYFQTA